MRLLTKINKHLKHFLIIPFIVFAYLLLLIPTESDLVIPEGHQKPFIWNKDSLWNSLEKDFIIARKSGCDKKKYRIDSLLADSEKLLNYISVTDLNPTDQKFILLEENIFKIAPLIPVCTQYFQHILTFIQG